MINENFANKIRKMMKDDHESVEAKDHYRYDYPPYPEKEKENMWKVWVRYKAENPQLTWEEFKNSAEYRDYIREQEMIDREELSQARKRALEWKNMQ